MWSIQLRKLPRLKSNLNQCMEKIREKLKSNFLWLQKNFQMQVEDWKRPRRQSLIDSLKFCALQRNQFSFVDAERKFVSHKLEKQIENDFVLLHKVQLRALLKFPNEQIHLSLLGAQDNWRNDNISRHDTNVKEQSVDSTDECRCQRGWMWRVVENLSVSFTSIYQHSKLALSL